MAYVPFDLPDHLTDLSRALHRDPQDLLVVGLDTLHRSTANDVLRVGAPVHLDGAAWVLEALSLKAKVAYLRRVPRDSAEVSDV